MSRCENHDDTEGDDGSDGADDASEADNEQDTVLFINNIFSYCFLENLSSHHLPLISAGRTH